MPTEQTQKPKLGTFLGVYLPTILTILGVIMYLRSGWLVGHMGLSRTLVIVTLANAITLITTLSFSSISTNIRVGVGGAYYIISRSLGLEIGGAVGLPLFLSQTFSVTLYAYGLAESLVIVWPDIPIETAAFVIVLLVGGLSMLGPKVALKSQIPVLALIGVSLLALIMGVVIHAWNRSVPIPPPSGEIPFWAAFAIFFPAVTGVMAGLGLSGDLKHPSRAIPRGSILAVITGFAVYLLIPVLLLLGAGRGDLKNNPLVWTDIAVLGPWLILPGLWGAIFSSAVGSMLGAPRTLQALANDRMSLRRRTKDIDENTKLITGLVLSILIALGAVFLGNLNTVAAVVTVFFLTTYGVMNIAAAIETLSGDPSWRPKFRIPWIVNLLGGLGCLWVIFLINPLAGVIAISVELLIWILLSQREQQAGWGDARRGFYEAAIRWALILLARRPMSARNWRPHVLVFVSDLIEHLDLVWFGNWFSQGRGVVSVCELIEGKISDIKIDLMGTREVMQKALDDEGLVVFPEIHVVNDVVEGIVNVTQANGLAGLQSNMILLGWPTDKKRLSQFLKIMRQLELLNKSFIIGRIKPKYIFPREGSKRSVHIWWGGLERNGDLMLLLAYLLTRNPEWRGAEIRIMSIANNKQMKADTEAYLQKLIPEIRIEAEPHVILRPRNRSVTDVIHEQSKNADVVMFGLATPEPGTEGKYAGRLETLASDLGTVFFVKNSSLFIGELVQPRDEYPEDNESFIEPPSLKTPE
jgi:amino acid transporter